MVCACLHRRSKLQSSLYLPLVPLQLGHKILSTFFGETIALDSTRRFVLEGFGHSKEPVDLSVLFGELNRLTLPSIKRGMCGVSLRDKLCYAFLQEGDIVYIIRRAIDLLKLA